MSEATENLQSIDQSKEVTQPESVQSIDNIHGQAQATPATANETAVEEGHAEDAARYRQGPVAVARALWDYEAVEDNELSFNAGQIINILELCNDDWYEGQIDDVVGYFPANRVQLLSGASVNGDALKQQRQQHHQESHAENTAVEGVGEEEQQAEHVVPGDANAAEKGSVLATSTVSSSRYDQIQPAQTVHDVIPHQTVVDDPFADFHDDDGSDNAVVATAEFSADDELYVMVSKEIDEKGRLEVVKGLESEVPTEEVTVPEVEDVGDRTEVTHHTSYTPTKPSSEWQTVTDDDGQVYYWNTRT
ncbi:spermatogenesis-associated protein 13, partial [Quaeritorhiza haematococci]